MERNENEGTLKRTYNINSTMCPHCCHFINRIDRFYQGSKFKCPICDKIIFKKIVNMEVTVLSNEEESD